MRLTGRVWIYGDHVDTDAIIPARYLATSDPQELAAHCMEDIDRAFASKVQPGDIMVAGEDFGCGSSREHAPVAIRGAGIACVVAASFARIFYRNAFNVGLPILVCPGAVAEIRDEHVLKIDLGTGEVANPTLGTRHQAEVYPPFILGLIKAGGLTAYTKQRLETGIFDGLRRTMGSGS